MKESILTLKNLHSHILWAPYGGDHRHPNACYSLHGPLSLHFCGVADTAEEESETRPWVNQWMDKFRSSSPNHGSGKINDNGLEEFPKSYLSPENTAKLEALRQKYDPDRVFHTALGPPRACCPYLKKWMMRWQLMCSEVVLLMTNRPAMTAPPGERRRSSTQGCAC